MSLEFLMIYQPLIYMGCKNHQKYTTQPGIIYSHLGLQITWGKIYVVSCTLNGTLARGTCYVMTDRMQGDNSKDHSSKLLHQWKGCPAQGTGLGWFAGIFLNIVMVPVSSVQRVCPCLMRCLRVSFWVDAPLTNADAFPGKNIPENLVTLQYLEDPTLMAHDMTLSIKIIEWARRFLGYGLHKKLSVERIKVASRVLLISKSKRKKAQWIRFLLCHSINFSQSVGKKRSIIGILATKKHFDLLYCWTNLKVNYLQIVKVTYSLTWMKVNDVTRYQYMTRPIVNLNIISMIDKPYII